MRPMDTRKPRGWRPTWNSFKVGILTNPKHLPMLFPRPLHRMPAQSRAKKKQTEIITFTRLRSAMRCLAWLSDLWLRSGAPVRKGVGSYPSSRQGTPQFGDKGEHQCMTIVWTNS
uniref:Uncharacterized protein n=1 Tax=Schistocephalus solidus TaxID=70667 RepID=A0A0X3PAM8_SCHSO